MRNLKDLAVLKNINKINNFYINNKNLRQFLFNYSKANLINI